MWLQKFSESSHKYQLYVIEGIFLSKIGKRLTLRLSTSLIQVKCYKEDFVFLVAMTVRDIKNHLLKNNTNNTFRYSGAIKTCKRFASPKTR